MDYEAIADEYGITAAHDERCQGDERCREHFIERLREAERTAAGRALFFTTTRIQLDGPPTGYVKVSTVAPEPSDGPRRGFILLFTQQPQGRGEFLSGMRHPRQDDKS